VNKETLEEASFTLDLFQLAVALDPAQVVAGVEVKREDAARTTTIVYREE